MSTTPKKAHEKPNPTEYTKWEKPLPTNLEDFMNQYVAWKEHDALHPEWKQTVVIRFQGEIQKMIHDHWTESSKSRKLFVAMNPAHVWEDQPNLIMRLTKRNLATLDPNFIPVLNRHILTAMTEYMENIRKEARAILAAIYAHSETISEVEDSIAGSEPYDYSFENYGNHLVLQSELRQELKSKFAVIEYCRQRELFVQNLVAWEKGHSSLSDVSGKGANNMLNWIAKFRIDASKILIAANLRATTLIKDYEEQTRKEFAMLGQKYNKLYLEPQKNQVAKVATNFSHMTADILFFDNPGDDAQGNPIVERVLDPMLEGIVRESVQLLAPPPMPEFAVEVKFQFQYY